MIERQAVALELSLVARGARPIAARTCIPPIHASPPIFVVATLLTVPAIAVAAGLFTIDRGELWPLFALFGMVAAFGWAFNRLNAARLGDVLWLSGMFYLVALSVPLACAVLARTGLPYADNALESIDRLLGFDWPAMIRQYQAHPRVAGALRTVYTTLNWEPQLAIVLLCVFRPGLPAYRFLTAWSLCLLLTTGIFPFVPAVSAFNHYRLDPADMHGPILQYVWKLHATMDGLRSGADTVLGTDNLIGLVTMPSFHAAAAVMLGWAFWSLRWLRWPFVTLNAVMIVSAMPVGGHYLADLLAGAMLAVVSILAATRLHRALSVGDGDGDGNREGDRPGLLRASAA